MGTKIVSKEYEVRLPDIGSLDLNLILRKFREKCVVQKGEVLIELYHGRSVCFEVKAPISGVVSAVHVSYDTPLTSGMLLGTICHFFQKDSHSAEHVAQRVHCDEKFQWIGEVLEYDEATQTVLYPIRVPRASEYEDDYFVIEVNIKEGDQVEEGTMVGLLETDKACLEFEAQCAGEVVSVHAQEESNAVYSSIFAVTRVSIPPPLSPFGAISEYRPFLEGIRAEPRDLQLRQQFYMALDANNDPRALWVLLWNTQDRLGDTENKAGSDLFRHYGMSWWMPLARIGANVRFRAGLVVAILAQAKRYIPQSELLCAHYPLLESLHLTDCRALCAQEWQDWMCSNVLLRIQELRLEQISNDMISDLQHLKAPRLRRLSILKVKLDITLLKDVLLSDSFPELCTVELEKKEWSKEEWEGVL